MWVDDATGSLGRSDALGGVDDLHVGSVVGKLLHPSFLEADASHLEVEGAVGEFYHLLWCWLVGLRVASGRHHHVDA
mgnify:CR=1 FL=1